MGPNEITKPLPLFISRQPYRKLQKNGLNWTLIDEIEVNLAVSYIIFWVSTSAGDNQHEIWRACVHSHALKTQYSHFVTPSKQHVFHFHRHCNVCTVSLMLVNVARTPHGLRKPLPCHSPYEIRFLLFISFAISFLPVCFSIVFYLLCFVWWRISVNCGLCVDNHFSEQLSPACTHTPPHKHSRRRVLPLQFFENYYCFCLCRKI